MKVRSARVVVQTNSLINTTKNNGKDNVEAISLSIQCALYQVSRAYWSFGLNVGFWIQR